MRLTPSSFGDRARVYGTVTAVGDQRKVAGVGAVTREHFAAGIGHVCVDDALDPPCRVEDVDAERFGHMVEDGVLGRADVEMHASARESVGGEVAEGGVGVGHGRVRRRPGRN